MLPRLRSDELSVRASRFMPGGVSSPVRSFRAVGGQHVFVRRMEGAYVQDADGNRYVDLVGSWGSAILGHGHPAVVEAVCRAAHDGLSFGASCAAEGELAELILSALPGHDMLRFVCSGTEAVMSAVRLARAVTERPLVAKFEGCYHGHSDALLAGAGSGAAEIGVPLSAGITDGAVADTVVLPYNDIEAVEALVRTRGERLAAIVVEPVAGNMGLVPAAPGFLEALREACSESGAMLIFDEVMTGFRVAWGGWQRVCGIRPDITCLGKVIGGGLPVAAYAAPRAIMQNVSPLGPMYQAGTLSGNPLGMAAGLATLRLCAGEGFYESLGGFARSVVDAINAAAMHRSVSLQAAAIGGMLGVFFAPAPVRDFQDARGASVPRFREFFHSMHEGGVWLPPSPMEAMFVSSMHGPTELVHIAGAAERAMEHVARCAG